MHEQNAILNGLAPTQIGILVPDLGAGIATYEATLGLKDWLVFTYSSETIPNLSYRGQPANCSFRVALAGSEPQFELIQPLEGESVYTEWIESRGYGIHHLGFHLPSIEKYVELFGERGLQPVQSGSGYGLDGDGAFAYFDTVDSMQLMLELIEVPARRRPSEPIPPVE